MELGTTIIAKLSTDIRLAPCGNSLAIITPCTAYPPNLSTLIVIKWIFHASPTDYGLIGPLL